MRSHRRLPSTLQFSPEVWKALWTTGAHRVPCRAPSTAALAFPFRSPRSHEAGSRCTQSTGSSRIARNPGGYILLDGCACVAAKASACEPEKRRPGIVEPSLAHHKVELAVAVHAAGLSVSISTRLIPGA